MLSKKASEYLDRINRIDGILVKRHSEKQKGIRPLGMQMEKYSFNPVDPVDPVQKNKCYVFVF